MKMLKQLLFTHCVIEIPGVQRENGDFQPLFQILQIDAADAECLITDDLGRRKFDDLVEQLFFTIQFSDLIFSGRNISNGKTEMFSHADDAHQIIVAAFIECLGIEVGAGCHDADHITLYDSLCLLRIFELFTDCNLVASGNEFI